MEEDVTFYGQAADRVYLTFNGPEQTYAFAVERQDKKKEYGHQYLPESWKKDKSPVYFGVAFCATSPRPGFSSVIVEKESCW